MKPRPNKITITIEDESDCTRSRVSMDLAHKENVGDNHCPLTAAEFGADSAFQLLTNDKVAALHYAGPEMLEVLKELAECSEYWSEYFVPLGIHERIAAAIAKAEGEE